MTAVIEANEKSLKVLYSMYASADGLNASAGALAKKTLLSFDEWLRFVKDCRLIDAEFTIRRDAPPTPNPNPNPNPNPDPNPDHGLARHREDSGLQPYGTRLQPYAAGLQPYAAGLQPLAYRLQPYVVRLQPYVVRLQPRAPRRVAAEDTGLLSATAWDPRSYARYSFPHAIWTAEIRFPIRATPGYATRGGGYPYP